MNLLPFRLPPLIESGPLPYWNGSAFIVGNSENKILEYSENFQGWNDELTQFHEDHAGENHAIDSASRAHTLTQIQQYSNIPNPIILEVGCSSGFMLKEFHKVMPNAILIGADIVREPLLNLAKQMPNTPLLRFDLTNCPLPDNSIDVVVLLNILEHIENDVAALEHVYRILKPGGIAIIEVPAAPNLYDLHDKLLLHFRRYSLNHLIALTKNTGFSIAKKSHLGCFIYPGFWLIKQKNKRLFFKSEAQQKRTIEKNIQYTRQNMFLSSIIKLELLLGKYVEYPFGIRCLLTVRKT
ncbi:MAG: class I SAM-dependent methyltransferase [Gammaproteobacteria bacterium]|nr:class I SAM-dependent methyltransferase [Gammaproteobacteria bacterium]